MSLRWTCGWIPSFSWSSGGSSSLTNSTLMWNSTATIRATFSRISCSCWIPVRHRRIHIRFCIWMYNIAVSAVSHSIKSGFREANSSWSQVNDKQKLTPCFVSVKSDTHWCGLWHQRRICHKTFWPRGPVSHEWWRAKGATRCSWRRSPSSQSPPLWHPSKRAQWLSAGHRGLLRWWGTK